MPDLPREVLDVLVRLMNDEIAVSDLDDPEEIARVGDAARRTERLIGEVVVSLNRDHGWSYEKIGERYGVYASTAYRWAQSYLKNRPKPDS